MAIEPPFLPLPMNREPERYIQGLNRLRPWLAGFAILVVQYSLYANILRRTVFLQPYEGGPATSPITALCISMIGLALIAMAAHAPKWLPILLLLSCLLAASWAALPAAVWGSAQLQSDLQGQMGFDTFCVTTVIGFAVLMRNRMFKSAATLAAVAFAMLLNSLIGRSYGLPYFAGEMAPGTMLALLFLALATITCFLDYAPTRVLFLNTSIGDVTRWMVFIGASVPWLCGMYLHIYYETALHAVPIEAILLTIIIACTTFSAIRAGNVLAKSDSQRRDAEELLQTLAITDPLTGLLNREGLSRKLSLRREDMRKSDKLAVVVLMDIDHFKSVNDEYGHDMGDQVLAHIKPILSPFLREGDDLARWGGEEFLISLFVKQDTDLQAIVERLRRAMISLPLRMKEAGVMGAPEISASFGVAMLNPDDPNLDAAISRADRALYKAKEEGRNRATFDGAISLEERAAARGITLVASD